MTPTLGDVLESAIASLRANDPDITNDDIREFLEEVFFGYLDEMVPATGDEMNDLAEEGNTDFVGLSK